MSPFILNAIFRELILIGIPVVVGVRAGWLWWEETARRGEKRAPLLWQTVARAIKVYLDGNWNVAIANFTLDYVVGSMVLILEWLLVIFGIPVTIGVIWWIRHETRKHVSEITS